MERDIYYFRRRAIAETLAAARAIMPEARDRHRELAQRYAEIVKTIEGSGTRLKRAANA